MQKKVCAITGHRPQKLPWGRGETSIECKHLKITLYNQIVRLANAGVTDFMSGMAEGTDTWAAQSVLHLQTQSDKIKLHCILPCKTQADQWSIPAKELYYSILEQADSIIYTNQKYQKGCMLERNRFLVDHATLLLAVYNGGQQGGTAATLRYARAKRREILIIDPKTQIVTHEIF